MGAYLSQPVKEKESSDGGNARVKFGTSAMQGWRTSMEVSETLSELLYSIRRSCVFVLRVLCFIVCWCWCWQTKGVCVVSTFCQNGRLLVEFFFFFQSTKKKAAKTKDDERAPPPPLLLSPFFFPFVVPRMDGCLSSFVVVRRRSFSKHRLLTCFGLCIVSSSL